MNALGDEVRAALGTGPDEARRQRQRARFIASSTVAPRGVWRELAVGTLAAALGSAVVFTLWQQRVPVPLKVLSSDGTTVVFNDGSRIEVGQFGSMHLERGPHDEVVVAIEYGSVSATVAKGHKNVWKFRAGPHEVTVRGTRLEVNWRPDLGSLMVAVSEGRVEVHLADGRVEWVNAGDRLEWAAEPEVRADEPAVAPAPAPVPVPVPAAEPVRPRPAGPKRALVAEWRRAAEAGQNARAVKLVEEQGLGGILQNATSDDLMLLADAARLVKRTDLGMAVLNQLRKRFPNAPEAAEAAFRLGRLEFDTHRYADAGAWFDTYVQEAPSGAFAAEAMGRRLDAWHRASHPKVRDAASEYLKAYRNGPYAALAKKVLESSP